MNLEDFRKDALPVVILSTADLDAPIWTNKQHIATRLAAEREVYYIDSMGLRTPTFSMVDLKRIIYRFYNIIRRAVDEDKAEKNALPSAIFGLKRVTPAVIPYHKSSIIRTINRRLVMRNILPKLPERYALWTFSPLTYGLEQRATKIVYHSVDLLHMLEGIPREPLIEAEKQLIKRADAVIASSEGVAKHLRSQGAKVHLWENVADINLFERMRAPVAKRQSRAIFVGNLTPGKVDFTILEAITARGLRLALAGPYSIDGSARNRSLDRLLSSPLVEYMGILNQEDMATELGKSFVGIIPYHINEYTAGVFPMKVYEYLGAGLQIVSTALPSLANRNMSGLTVTDADSFSEKVEDLIAGGYKCPAGDFSQNSWDSRVSQIRQLLDADWRTDLAREA